MRLEKIWVKVIVKGRASKAFYVNRGLRYDDPLCFLTFYVLKIVLTESEMHTKETIYYFEYQIVAYADDIGLM